MFCFLFLSNNQNTFSQTETHTNKTDVLLGGGNYEYLHGGLKITNKKEYYFETAIGLKPWRFSEEKYFMGYVAFGSDYPVIKEKQRLFVPSLQLKLLIWDLDNKFNHFLFWGVTPEVGLSYRLNEKIKIKVNGGVAYNMQIIYQRKTYEEVGWPKDWQPTFSIQINYKLK